ncbi:MAG: tRNA-dihydrouridine synthase A [Woeseiaceae bacterium]|jgi:tRNA-dihydrouridine synthase A
MNHKINIAPMMDWTDRHCRFFMRLLSPSVRRYTEMITAAALQHGNAEKLLRFDQSEHPVALQIGGSDAELMAGAARKGERAGYDEININVGCPSDRVQSGQFGACLMSSPDRVATCVAAMRAAVKIPVTIKSRIGVDDQDSYDFLRNFVSVTRDSGCETFVVHARKAILSGLSPKDNRTVPPLIYERVYRLKKEFPDLNIILNGGIGTVEDCQQHLKHVDGVMIGRQAYQTPWLLTELEQELGDVRQAESRSRDQVVQQMIPYIIGELRNGAQLKHITRHMLGLFSGQPGARAWRRTLSEQAHMPGAGIEVLETALAKLPRAA